MDIYEGMRVRIKTHDELIASGWEYIPADDEDGDKYRHLHCDTICDEMVERLGTVVTVGTVYDDDNNFEIEEDGGGYGWHECMVAEVVHDKPKCIQRNLPSWF